ncbi:MAG: pantoate--beta-alanine ligase [Sphingorhabdus sp.]
MQIINHLASLRDNVAILQRQGKKIALVPTMGALHAGHMQLVKTAMSKADAVVTSIFVNPTQFGEGEDLNAYPRTLEADAKLLEAEGAALVWAPLATEIYPQGFSTSIHMTGLSDDYCGAARPGHFDGVALVVVKLLNQVTPDFAFFGEKDWQQLAVIRRMASDLDFAVQVEGVPIVRDSDGLALSSRNRYLSKSERAAAAALPAALQKAAKAIGEGADVGDMIGKAIAALTAAGFTQPDYLTLVDAQSLQRLETPIDAPMRLIAAARIGKTRLIDNVAVDLRK